MYSFPDLLSAVTMAKLFIAAAVVFALIICTFGRSFTIDYDDDTFLKDGKAFRYEPCEGSPLHHAASSYYTVSDNGLATRDYHTMAMCYYSMM